MDRKALIIGNPGYGEAYLRGVEKDLVNYESFLKSPLGGAWREQEIVTLSDQGKINIASQVNAVKTADYSLIVFSGHGYVDGKSKSTILIVKNGDELNSKELRFGAPKHTLILDCCRVVEVPERILMEAFVKKMAPSLNPQECRYYYNKRIEECAVALVVLFACSEDETAGDTPQGGRYSVNLINAAKNWLNNSSINPATHSDILSVVGAHTRARKDVQGSSGNRQNPEIEQPRCEKYFPFAVIA
jgi:hypothetical protein